MCELVDRTLSLVTASSHALMRRPHSVKDIRSFSKKREKQHIFSFMIVGGVLISLLHIKCTLASTFFLKFLHKRLFSHFFSFIKVKRNIHSVSYVYAVLPFYDVKDLCSGGRE